jgi:hypothetical protein
VDTVLDPVPSQIQEVTEEFEKSTSHMSYWSIKQLMNAARHLQVCASQEAYLVESRIEIILVAVWVRTIVYEQRPPTAAPLETAIRHSPCVLILRRVVAY